MKKTRKGLTLVEVIVSIAVFTIISLALFSTILSMNKVVKRQEEYVRLEMACQDIDYYWDVYGKSGGCFNSIFNIDGTNGQGYLKFDGYNLELSSNSDGEFIVNFEYSDGKLLITSIRSTSDNREYLTKGSINFGTSKKEVTNE